MCFLNEEEREGYLFKERSGEEHLFFDIHTPSASVLAVHTNPVLVLRHKKRKGYGDSLFTIDISIPPWVARLTKAKLFFLRGLKYDERHLRTKN